MRTLILAALFATGVTQASFAQSQPFVAQIMLFGGTFCPVGWHLADGTLLPINQNQALFSLLGTTYGGNGTTNFALPNMKPLLTANRAGVTQCIAMQGIFPSRS